jgi:hypothetical protein
MINIEIRNTITFKISIILILLLLVTDIDEDINLHFRIIHQYINDYQMPEDS